MSRLGRTALALGLAALTAGCHDATGPSAEVRAAAGVYVLTTVNGVAVPTSDRMAPSSGSIYLWPSGHAERHITYRSSDGGTEDVESVGSFHFENGAIVFELRPKGDSSPGSGKLYGSLDDGTLTLGYSGPADGWVEEEYLRK